MTYGAFAKRITETGIVTDPWLDGEPRFREAPLVVAKADARAMYRAAEAIAEAYNEACMLVSDSPDLLDSFFGLTPWQKAMWMASEPLWHGIARADVFRTRDGLQIAELNCDTPTGEAEAVVLGELADGDPNRGLATRFALVAEAMAQRSEGSVGIVYPTELPEDLSLVRLYTRAFEARGWDVTIGSPFNLTTDDERLHLFETPIDLVVRHYKTDWWGERESVWRDEEVLDRDPLDAPLAAILGATLAETATVINPFGAVVPQNKRTMAFMWERIHLFSPRAQETIRAHVPVTRRLEAIDEAQLRRERADWVIKSDYGAEGDEVVIGRLVSEEVWNETLALARPGRFVAQRWFEALTEEGGTVNHGVFLLAGEAAGLYARVQAGPTDERALSVPVTIA